MDLVAPNLTFSIPFRRENAAFGSLPEFVGDQPNLMLKYLAEPGEIRSCDWPLTLYGPPGTGKTELAHSVILGVAEFGRRPIITSATEFSRSFRSAVETDSVREFRNRHLKSGGVMLDQLEDLERFPKAQMELVYLIDRLTQREVPLVATSSGAFEKSELILPQLASRMAAGLCLPVHPPGKLARRKIIDQLTQSYSISLGATEIDYLVDRLAVTVPKISQFFAQWTASNPDRREISNAELETYFDRTMLADSVRLMDLITDVVATEFQLTSQDLVGSSRKQTTALARSIAAYFARKLLGVSFAKIGEHLGNRDHSTIMHSYNKARLIAEEANSTDSMSGRMAKLELQLNEKLAACV